MKFSLVVFLGLCAIASADIFDEVPDVPFIKFEPVLQSRSISLPSFVTDFLKKATDEFNGLIQEYKDITGTVKSRAQSVMTVKETELSSKATGFFHEVMEMAKQGPKYAACGKEHQTELMDLTNAASLGIKECATQVVAALRGFAEDVLGASTALIADILRLKDIIFECYNKSSIGAAKCVFDHFNELKTLVSKLISETRETIAAFKEHGEALINSVKNCNENNIQTTVAKFQNIKSVILECANAN